MFYFYIVILLVRPCIFFFLPPLDTLVDLYSQVLACVLHAAEKENSQWQQEEGGLKVSGTHYFQVFFSLFFLGSA